MPSLNLVLTYSKQVSFLIYFKRFYSQPVPHPKRLELIKQLTDSPEMDVAKTLELNPFLETVPEEEISQRLDKLKSLQLKDKTLLSKLVLVKHHPKTIKHRYQIFRELGIPTNKISSQILLKYVAYIKKKISYLKKMQLLDKNCDVVQNLLSLTPLDSSCLDIEFNDSHSPDEVKIYILKKLLVNLVGFSEPIDEKWVMFQRLRHKSITETLRNLSVLQHDVGLPIDKIRSNPFLLSAADADNTHELIEMYPVLAGTPIRTVLKNHCKILASTVHNFTKTYQYLSEAGISDEALSKCFEVFTLNSETVRERLEECQKHKLLSVCQHHPRILELIIYHKKALNRIKKLESVNCNFFSITLLSSANKMFNKFFEEGSIKYHGKESVYYLSKELNYSRELIKAKLKKHPFRSFVSLYVVSTNLKALRSKGFTSEEIFNELCILLYPTSMVIEELDKVALRPESDVCKDENGVVMRQYILPLTLYYIERSSNFEGKAIWFWESGTFSNPKIDTHLSEEQMPFSTTTAKKPLEAIHRNSDS